jgi:hypothetical protein
VVKNLNSDLSLEIRKTLQSIEGSSKSEAIRGVKKIKDFTFFDFFSVHLNSLILPQGIMDLSFREVLNF